MVNPRRFAQGRLLTSLTGLCGLAALTAALVTAGGIPLPSNLPMLLPGAALGLVIAAAGMAMVMWLTARPINHAARMLRRVSLEADAVACDAGSRRLAQGVTEQAASLEAASHALDQLVTRACSEADGLDDCAGIAADVRAAAQRCNEALPRINAALGGIEQVTAESAGLVKVIDEIAFETNLLALNAAVEAARAGSAAGGGFASVAAELRNLAMRSTEAAGQMGPLVEQSLQASRGGAGIADELAGLLRKFTDSSTSIDTAVSEIATTSRQRAQGLEQIGLTIGQIARASRRNGADADAMATANDDRDRQFHAAVEAISAALGLPRTPPAQPAEEREPEMQIDRAGPDNVPSKLLALGDHPKNLPSAA